MVGVSTSEITEALRKASRLRGEVEQLEREAPRRRSLAGRVFSFVTRSLACVVIIVLAIDGWFAYDAFRDEAPGSGATAEATAGGPTYSDLVIFEDFDRFGGRVAITNPFPRDIEVFVDVDLYDGDQAVGELNGEVTLRPDSTSVVELDWIRRVRRLHREPSAPRRLGCLDASGRELHDVGVVVGQARCVDLTGGRCRRPPGTAMWSMLKRPSIRCGRSAVGTCRSSVVSAASSAVRPPMLPAYSRPERAWFQSPPQMRRSRGRRPSKTSRARVVLSTWRPSPQGSVPQLRHGRIELAKVQPPRSRGRWLGAGRAGRERCAGGDGGPGRASEPSALRCGGSSSRGARGGR